jgi:hypothetical protein
MNGHGKFPWPFVFLPSIDLAGRLLKTGTNEQNHGPKGSPERLLRRTCVSKTLSGRLGSLGKAFCRVLGCEKKIQKNFPGQTQDFRKGGD